MPDPVIFDSQPIQTSPTFHTETSNVPSMTAPYAQGTSTPPNGGDVTDVNNPAPDNAPSQGVVFDSVPVSHPAIPNSLHLGGDPTTLSGGLHNIFAGINAVGAGAGQEVLSTLNGGAHILHLPHATLEARQKELEQQNSENPTLNTIGKGAESIAEFLTGDEALKGLSMADKYAHVAKIMKMAEKSPRLAAALKLGAIQAAQTGVKTGGDAEAALKSGVVGGATGGALGLVGEGVSNVLGRGGKAANTIAEMNDTAQNAPTRTDVEDQLSNAVHNAHSSELGTLQNNLDDATSTVGMFGEGAPQLSEITAKAKEFADAGKKSVHGAYRTGFEQLKKMAGNATIPYEDSPLHNAAKSLASEGQTKAGPLDEALNIDRPGSPKANRVIDNLSSFGKQPEEEAAGGGAHSLLNEFLPQDEAATTAGAEGEEPAPASIGMQHLVEYRQKLARLLRDVPPNTEHTNADKAAYQTLLKGTDDTIGQLADGVGKTAEIGEDGEPLPSKGRQFFDSMNESYRQGIQPFANRDVKNILKGNLDNVAKSIMGGQTSLDDINSVKKALGPQNFSKVSQASLQNIVRSFADSDTGEVDYKKLFQTFNKINPEVRTAMFGNQGTALAQALKVANNSEAGMGEIGKKITGLLGTGDIDSVLQSPKQAQQLATAIGPEGMKTLGQSIMQNKIAEASTILDPKTGQIVKANFDPDKVLDWWMSMKNTPEVRDAFFSVDKDSAKQYDQMMSRLAQASSVKKLVKYGVLPITLGTAGLVHGPLGALTGALAGLGTEAGFGRARDILDAVANNPRTWKLLGGIGNATESPVAEGVGKAAQIGAVNAAGRATEPDKDKE